MILLEITFISGRPRVGLFAPLRDKVTSSAQSLVPLCRVADAVAASNVHQGFTRLAPCQSLLPLMRIEEYMKKHALRPDADAEMRLTVGSGFANVRTVLGVPMLREGTPKRS
jgi:hypothetical protein